MSTAISAKEKSEICPDCQLIECKPLGHLCAVRKHRNNGKGNDYINPKIDRKLVTEHLAEIRAAGRKRPDGKIYVKLPSRERFVEFGLLGSPTTAGQSWWLVVSDRWLVEQLGEIAPSPGRGSPGVFARPKPPAPPAPVTPEAAPMAARPDPRKAAQPAAPVTEPAGIGRVDGNHLDREKVMRNLTEIRSHARRWSNGKVCIRLDRPARFAELGLMGSPLQSSGKGLWWVASSSTWLRNVLGPIPPAQTRTSREDGIPLPDPGPSLPPPEPPAERTASGPVPLDPSFPTWHGTIQILHFTQALGLDRRRQLTALRLAVAAVEAELECANG